MATGVRWRGRDTWELRVYAGNGRRVTRTFRGTERQAVKARAQLAAEVHQGRAVPGQGRTVATLLDRWYEAKSSDWSEQVVYEHRRVIDRVLVPALGAIPLSRLATADVDAFYGHLRRRGLKPASVRRVHSTLRSALEQGVRWGWIGMNPAATASPPSVPRPTVRPPSVDELLALLEVARANPDFYLYVHLSALTGARRSELVRLRWSDIEGDEVVIHKGKTEAATRRLALDAGTLALLVEQRERQAERARLAEARLVRGAYVFSWFMDASVPWRDDYPTAAFARLRRHAGVSGVRLHDLRHYVATRLISAGVDVRTVAGRLGHASPYTTLGVYSHFEPASDRAAADLLAALLRRETGQTDR